MNLKKLINYTIIVVCANLQLINWTFGRWRSLFSAAKTLSILSSALHVDCFRFSDIYRHTDHEVYVPPSGCECMHHSLFCGY